VKVQDLLGAKVWVEQPGLAEHVGYIAAVSEPVNLEDIKSSVDASMFRIVMESGDVVDTSGFNLLEIEHAGYIKESAGNQLADKTYIVRFKTPDLITDVVDAARVEVQGEHLAFVTSKGRLAALFLFESVASWSELPPTGIRGSPKQRSSFG
jgi:hypothetical protein